MMEVQMQYMHKISKVRRLVDQNEDIYKATAHKYVLAPKEEETRTNRRRLMTILLPKRTKKATASSFQFGSHPAI